MQKILATYLALAAFLAVSGYWCWQIATGRPAIDVEYAVLRAFLAMIATYVLGRLIARLGVSMIAEAWQEAGARRRDREVARAIAAQEEEEGAGGASAEGTAGQEAQAAR
jgi:hypothetical protein